MFQLKRRPSDYFSKKNRKHEGKPSKERMDAYGYSLSPDKLPYLVELSPGKTGHFLGVVHEVYRATFSKCMG